MKLDDETKRQIKDLADWWDIPAEHRLLTLIRRLVAEAHARESARREMAAHDEAIKRQDDN